MMVDLALPMATIQALRAQDRGAYAASLMCPRAMRGLVQAVACVQDALFECVWRTQEPLAAHMRVAWWRDTAKDSAALRGSGHPTAAALWGLQQQSFWDEAVWERCLAGVLHLLDWQCPADRDTQAAQAVLICGGFVELLARVDGVVLEQERAAASVLLLSGMMMRMAARGWCMIPQEILRTREVTDTQLMQGEVPRDVARALVLAWAGEVWLHAHKSGVAERQFRKGNPAVSWMVVAKYTALRKEFSANEKAVFMDLARLDARVHLRFLLQRFTGC